MSLREQNKAKARAAILQAARELIAEKGAAQATTREIASRASVSYQTLYNYFPSKSSILKEILSDDVALWSAEIAMLIKNYTGDLLGTLDEINRIGVRIFVGANEDLWRQLGSMLLQNDLEPEQFDSLNNVAHERYHALLSMAAGMGHLRPDIDLHLFAHTLYCLTDYAMMRFFVFPNMSSEQLLVTLREQFEILLTPYMIETPAPSS